jgi:hypothetical protein
MEIRRPDHDILMRRLLDAAAIPHHGQDELFLYFSATRGTGASEGFVRQATGEVSMVDPHRRMFDFLYGDWCETRGNPQRAWTWGWARFGTQSVAELHLFNDPLSDEDIVGLEHRVAWRRKVFGDAKIHNPP